jgi:hypothetical protein
VSTNNLNSSNNNSQFEFILSFLIKGLFTIIIIELVLGGGGRFFEVGSLTLRILMFLVALILTLINIIFRENLDKKIILISVLFLFTNTFGVLIGLINGATLDLILEDIKPLSFFLILPFFSMSIKSMNDIYLVKKILIRGSIFLAFTYLITIFLISNEFIDFLTFYEKQNEIGEIFFRGGPFFFYKGFLYLCVGFFFILSSNISFKNLFLTLLFVSILLTFTRGFIIFTSLIAIYYIFFINKNQISKFLWFLVIISSVFYLGNMMLESIGDRSSSDITRYVQLDQVVSKINILSLFVGHGLGVGTEERPVHMENSFLEIFHKQGILGLFFWFSLLFYIFFMYVKIKNKKFKKTALPFMLCTVFVFLQSLTNPFINNPIGLTMVLISFVVFNKFLIIEKALL